MARNFGVDYIRQLNKQPKVIRFSELGGEHGPDREVDFTEMYIPPNYSMDFPNLDLKSEQEIDEEIEEKERQEAESKRRWAKKIRRMKIALLSIDINYQALLLLKLRDNWGFKKIKKCKLVYTSRGKPAALSTLRMLEKKACRAVDEAYNNILAREEADEGR
jgi:hypothetical protein